MTTTPDLPPGTTAGLTVFTVTEIRTTTVRVEAWDRQHAQEVGAEVITAARESDGWLEGETRYEVVSG